MAFSALGHPHGVLIQCLRNRSKNGRLTTPVTPCGKLVSGGPKPGRLSPGSSSLGRTKLRLRYDWHVLRSFDQSWPKLPRRENRKAITRHIRNHSPWQSPDSRSGMKMRSGFAFELVNGEVQVEAPPAGGQSEHSYALKVNERTAMFLIMAQTPKITEHSKVLIVVI